MKKIGITGGIGSGKSTVCRVFAMLGAAVYDSDREARRLMNRDPQLIMRINSLFGPEAYRDGELNRSYVAAAVFNDPALLAQLNGIVHPAVAADFQQWSLQQQMCIRDRH